MKKDKQIQKLLRNAKKKQENERNALEVKLTSFRESLL
jgi:hypothetical protein